MVKTVIKTLFLCSLAGLSIACNDELNGRHGNDNQKVIYDGLPLEFEIILPQTGETRGLDFPKRSFVGGDIIHIEGEYEMLDNTIVRKYGALSYNEADDQWEPFYDKSDEVVVSTLTWPNNAKTGKFRAFYISGSDYLLKPGVSTPEASLSGMEGSSKETPDRDPLQSIKNETIDYGHTIRLEFEHACSYLTIEELPAGTSTIFWFTQEAPKGTVSPDFFNGYTLSLNSDNHLSLNFIQMEDSYYDNAVYVAGNAESYTNEEDEERTKAGFYLAPGEYKSFIIGYPGAFSMTNYLSYSKKESDIQDPEDANPDNILVANGVYVFNVSKSSGLTLETPPQEEDWAEDAPPWHKVDAEKFLWSACNGLEYINAEGTPILQPIANGVKLLCNIDMDFQQYTVFGPSEEYVTENNPDGYFEPNLDNGKVFEGGKFYIHNLGSPLFRYNNGSIRNLGISGVNETVISVEAANAYLIESLKPGFDLSRQGIICNWNTGNISNIRMKGGYEGYDQNLNPTGQKIGLTINAYILATDDAEAHNLGGIVGANTGTIENVRIADNFNITVSNYEGSTEIPTVNIGGLIGQNAYPGVLIDLDVLTGVQNTEPPQINIINNCNGISAAYRIGGICGANNGGSLTNVTLPQVSIKSQSSSGYESMIGGLSGLLSNSSGSIMRSCRVINGSILAGYVAPSGDLVDSYSYIGGVAGLIYDPNVITNCTTGVSVGGTSQFNADALYATGGAFGRIDNEGTGSGELSNITANGDNLRGPSSYMGNFAGIVPLNMTWEMYQASDIWAKTHYNAADPAEEIPNIGTTME